MKMVKISSKKDFSTKRYEYFKFWGSSIIFQFFVDFFNFCIF